MERRLRIAHRLLSNEGVIFISIDDNEQAQLKMLMDDIFGEGNFIASVIWKRKRGRDNSARWFSKAHEYCLVYSCNKDKFNINKVAISEDSDTRKQYKNLDNDPRGDYRKLGCWARGTQGGVSYSFEMKDGYFFSERLWLMSKDNLKKLDCENKLVRVGDKLYRKYFISEHKGQVPKTIWDNLSNSANASDMIKKMFDGKIVFDTAKPTEYIAYMLKLGANSESIILDFFAGSGTTGHAVAQLNKEDGGNRKYILCTNNENNICEEITYQRLKNIQEDLPHNLKYLKTGFIPKFSEGSDDSIRSKMMDHIVELIELENLKVIDGKNIAIVFDEGELDVAISTINDKGIIYHPAEVLFTSEQKAQLQIRDIEIKEIPEYYYATELRDVGEL